MCLIAFAIGQRADTPFMLASNRDEFWLRPTLPLQAWKLPSGKTVYSGRDGRAGGCWIGFAEDGRMAMLTNVRDDHREEAPRSRGELVMSWLDSDGAWEPWLASHEPHQYGGFNLVVGDMGTGSWTWLTNRMGTPTHPSSNLKLQDGWYGSNLCSGLYGLSNAQLDSPWPKTLTLKTALSQYLQANAPQDTRPLLEALLRCQPAPWSELPHTGVPQLLERQLSSAFVRIPDNQYGTRSSLIARCTATGELLLDEWTHDTDNAKPGIVSATGIWPLAHSAHRRLTVPDWGKAAAGH